MKKSERWRLASIISSSIAVALIAIGIGTGMRDDTSIGWTAVVAVVVGFICYECYRQAVQQ